MSDETDTIQIEVSTGADGVPVVALRGELDFATAPVADASIAPLLADQPARVVFDLTGVTFLDSSGIAVLVRSAHQAGTVAIRNPSTVVRRVIECTGLEETLHIES
jgi:anti-sigma B factor antagonist